MAALGPEMHIEVGEGLGTQGAKPLRHEKVILSRLYGRPTGRKSVSRRWRREQQESSAVPRGAVTEGSGRAIVGPVNQVVRFRRRTSSPTPANPASSSDDGSGTAAPVTSANEWPIAISSNRTEFAEPSALV